MGTVKPLCHQKEDIPIVEGHVLFFDKQKTVPRIELDRDMSLSMLDDVVVSFPADYPNSVKHFLMLGFVGMLIGSAIFFYFGFVAIFLISVSLRGLA